MFVRNLFAFNTLQNNGIIVTLQLQTIYKNMKMVLQLVDSELFVRE